MDTNDTDIVTATFSALNSTSLGQVSTVTVISRTLSGGDENFAVFRLSTVAGVNTSS